jgi:hypothetical protein
MPVTSHATIGPLEQVWSFGWFINRLLERPPTAMTVLGTWLIAFPLVLPAIPMLVLMPLLTPPDELPHMLIGVIPTAVLALCYGILVVRVSGRTIGASRMRPAHGNRPPEPLLVWPVAMKPASAGECRRGDADRS